MSRRFGQAAHASEKIQLKVRNTHGRHRDVLPIAFVGGLVVQVLAVALQP